MTPAPPRRLVSGSNPRQPTPLDMTLLTPRLRLPREELLKKIDILRNESPSMIDLHPDDIRFLELNTGQNLNYLRHLQRLEEIKDDGSGGVSEISSGGSNGSGGSGFQD